ncbi:MAG: hypothetical protein IPO91_03955 [Chloroflexi bacterium]|nr:hypothetical protein [Chloroflexota bacterium]
MTKLIRFQISMIVVAGLLSSCGLSLEDTGRQSISRYITLPSTARNLQTYYQSIGMYRAAYAYFELNPQQTAQFLSTTCFLGVDNFNNQYPQFSLGNLPEQNQPTWWNVTDLVLIREGGCDRNGMSWRIGIAEGGSAYKLYLVLVFP